MPSGMGVVALVACNHMRRNHDIARLQMRREPTGKAEAEDGADLSSAHSARENMLESLSRNNAVSPPLHSVTTPSPAAICASRRSPVTTSSAGFAEVIA